VNQSFHLYLLPAILSREAMTLYQFALHVYFVGTILLYSAIAHGQTHNILAVYFNICGIRR